MSPATFRKQPTGAQVAGGCGLLILSWAAYLSFLAFVIWLAATIIHGVFF
jgi:hypothetical protein